ncbi:TOBE domain-containing protein [Sulfurospirillum arcachonense]|uniref:TOBE domain-containing protein n=1 Tax=Sulfurospirillum arcachonense TaxID=57666 RepID=UPI00046A3259|nr:TOBE domain-containing protein [Sulfurospirillum arcachonense]
MEISSNLTLELANTPFLLEKRINLLHAIDKVGSISKAAKVVPMSYKSAWEAVDAMNNLSPTPIVEKETGGAGGGGTKLTSYGKNLLKTYEIIEIEQKRFLEKLTLLTDMDNGTMKTIRRLSMHISARNQLFGKIGDIKRAKVNAEVSVVLKSGVVLVSNITNSAVEELGLEVGNGVVAIIKASSVILTTVLDLQTSARNKLVGVVTNVKKGEVNSQVSVDVGDTDVVVATITTGSVESLNLEVGTKVCTMIKSSSIIIGK